MADQALLLPFQRDILSQLVPSLVDTDDAVDSRSTDTGNALVILARGLGMRSIIATLLKAYQSPDQLVLVVNATLEEERGLGEEVGMKLKTVGYEMPAAARQDLYKSGGLLSVTSRILVVDMLTNKIPVELLTGLVILHGETVTPTSVEAFIVRIFRKHNKTGFIKAFSDEPEAFSFGISPLQTVLQQLKIREVLIYPRFHESIITDLQKRKADVVELYQPLSDAMRDIQTAVLECMEATLSEIKRSNTYLEVEDLTVENALFRSFDQLVRIQLDPVWHKVGPKTRGLVTDLTALRKLQAYLLEFDCVSFNRFLDTVLTAQETTKSGYENRHKSPWLFTAAADTIFSVARERVYKKIAPKAKDEDGVDSAAKETAVSQEEDWEAEEEVMRALEEEMLGRSLGLLDGKGKGKAEDDGKIWGLPEGIEPVLEQQPKWTLLRDVLDEIETELYWDPVDPLGVSNDTILVMCSTSDTCATLQDFLTTASNSPHADSPSPAFSPLAPKLVDYFHWKATLGKMHRHLTNRYKKGPNMANPKGGGLPHSAKGPEFGKHLVAKENGEGFESAAMKRKREYQRGGGAPSGKRRRVRGGGAIGGSPIKNGSGSGEVFEKPRGADGVALEAETVALADIMDATSSNVDVPAYLLSATQTPAVDANVFSESDFDAYFGLLANEDLVIVRPYSGDEDDRVLEELRPKYIVMYDPEPSFVRRVEAYRASHPGLAVRVYFLMYKDSVEEQRYLSSIRKEKDAFERLIRERGSMAIPHEAEWRPGEEEAEALRTFSTRTGGRAAKTTPPVVVVDVREFRSTLPSLLHAGNFEVEPTTISVGDYIITPEMCVERKSLPDLISSFNSGRLYQQCEQMTAHYKQPILLIEFDEKKSFNMDTYAEPKAKGGPDVETDLRSKLVLLTITFPRLRIIWSSSPYETVEIFRELKSQHDEPDVEKAISVGVDEAVAEGTGEAGLAYTAQELLRNLPGIATSNYRYVTGKVENVEALVSLELDKMQELIGVEKGRTLHNFLHRDVTSLLDLWS